LALRGAKWGRKTCLVELDRFGGGIDLLFGAENEPGWRWSELKSARGNLGDISAQLPCVAEVSLLAAGRAGKSSRSLPIRAESAEETPEQELGSLPVNELGVNSVLSSLRNSFDLLVIDQGRAEFSFGNEPLLLLVAAESKAVFSALERLGAGQYQNAQLVVRTGRGRTLPPDQVSSVLGLPLLGVMRDDKLLPESLEAGDPPGRQGGKSATLFDSLLKRLDVVNPANSHFLFNKSKSDIAERKVNLWN
jgi:hypothetical protein